MQIKFETIVKICIAGLTLQLSACKTSSIASQSNESETLSETSFDPVVLVLGGFWSCGSNTKSKNFADWSPTEAISAAGSMSKIGTKNFEALKAGFGSNAKFLFSCYTPEMTIESINYISSFDQDKGITRTSIEEMISQLNANLEKLNRPKVAILGHSYGGWTAMKVAQNLTKKATLTNLITIDPISRVGCTPPQFLEGMKNKVFNTPCHEAPKDFSPKDIETLAQRSVVGWHNFYQLEAKYLHSSSFGSPLLKEDAEVKYNTKKDDLLSSHIRFLQDETLNEKITNIIIDGMKK